MNAPHDRPKHAALPSAINTPADAEVIRSEEQAVIRTARVPTRRARLQRFVVTEQRTITVELRHEEARLVYEDIDPDSVAPFDAAQTEQPMPSLLLREEQVEITRRIVPTERVSLVKEQVTTREEVPVELRNEQVSIEREI